jgi:hypothetical protein
MGLRPATQEDVARLTEYESREHGDAPVVHLRKKLA